MDQTTYIARLEATLREIAKGHWEAQTYNSWERSYNAQWGTFATKEEALAVAQRERDTHNDTGSYADGVYVLDLEGEEILKRIQETLA
jgi:hypothetical protein